MKNKIRKVSLIIVLFTIIAFVALMLFSDLDLNIMYNTAYMVCFERDVEVDENEVTFIANKLFEDMKKADSGMLEGYKMDSLTECYLIYQFLDKNILLGSCTKPVIEKGKEGYIIGWKNGENIIRQHEEAEKFIDDIKSDLDFREESQLKSLEKIADKICSIYITEYDYTYTNRSVYDLYTSLNSSGVCTVYSSLFKALCSENEIKSTVLIGKTKLNNEFHVWNKVFLDDGSVHYYDLTAYAESKDKRFLDISKKNYENLYFESSEYVVATKVNLNFGG